MNLIYYPNSFLEKQVKQFDIENPPVDPKELKVILPQIIKSKRPTYLRIGKKNEKNARALIVQPL